MYCTYFNFTIGHIWIELDLIFIVALYHFRFGFFFSINFGEASSVGPMPLGPSQAVCLLLPSPPPLQVSCLPSPPCCSCCARAKHLQSAQKWEALAFHCQYSQTSPESGNSNGSLSILTPRHPTPSSRGPSNSHSAGCKGCYQSMSVLGHLPKVARDHPTDITQADQFLLNWSDIAGWCEVVHSIRLSGFDHVLLLELLCSLVHCSFVWARFVSGFAATDDFYLVQNSSLNNSSHSMSVTSWSLHLCNAKWRHIYPQVWHQKS